MKVIAPFSRLVCTTLISAMALVASSGCLSTKYKMSRAGMASAQPLNFFAVQPPLETTINTVIVLQGPGSWKEQAYWDEYVVTIANRGDAPISIESATLTDFQGATVSTGENPWSLESASRSYEARALATAGNIVAIGSATAVTGTAAGAILVFGTATSQASVAALVGGGVTLAAAAVAIPVYSAVANINNRRAVETEFQRRRLATPTWLVPGQVAQGSLFFRVTPGPKQLLLRGHSGQNAIEAVIPLMPLANLHLKATPAEKKLAAATPVS